MLRALAIVGLEVLFTIVFAVTYVLLNRNGQKAVGLGAVVGELRTPLYLGLALVILVVGLMVHRSA